MKKYFIFCFITFGFLLTKCYSRTNTLSDDEESRKSDSPKEHIELPHPCTDKENCNHEINKVESLPDCKSQIDERDVMIVSTLDGNLNGIDPHKGTVLWTLPTGEKFQQLVSSSLSKLEISSKREWIRLIPSLDGGIYRFDGENVQSLPINAEDLLHSSYKFNEDTIFTGGKSIEVWGVEASTGNVVYFCNSEGCHNQQSVGAQSGTVIVIKRINHIVRAINPLTGNERWNFSVGLHEANVAGGSCASSQSSDPLELPSFRFIVPEGTVYGQNQMSLEIIWKQKFNSPIVNAWLARDNKLSNIDLFAPSTIPALSPSTSDDNDSTNVDIGDPSLYVGLFKDQLYIQANKNTHYETISSHFYPENEETHLPKVEWKPYLASAPSRTPVIHTFHNPNNHPLLEYQAPVNDDLAIPNDAEYPYDSGYYLYNSEDLLTNVSDGWDAFDSTEYETPSSEYVGSFFMELHEICLVWGPNYVWICLASILGFITIYMMWYKFIMHRLRNKMIDRQARIYEILDIIQNNPRVLTLIDTIRNYNTNDGNVALPSTVETPVEAVDLTPSTPNNSLTSNPEFVSRYHTDFEPLSCLGRGGFGVVFHVRNRLDENEYAVKRILLPANPKSAERVKREVRALAKLNHANIVRYYNSWLETPPAQWQVEKDIWWQNEASFTVSHLLEDDDQTELSQIVAKKKKTLSQIISNNTNLPSNSTNSNSNSNSNNNKSDSDESDSIDSESTSESDVSEEQNKECEENSNSFEVFFEETSQNETSSRSGISFVSSNKQSEHKCDRSRCASASCRYVNEMSENQNFKRRRTKSVILDSKKDRPSSLDLAQSYSSPTDSGVTEPSPVVPLTFLYIQMELCMKESLKDWLLNNHVREPSAILSIFNNIVHAVEFIHDNQMIHRDLKPSNIFFSQNEEVKVGDFGLVTSIADDAMEVSTPGTVHLAGNNNPIVYTKQAGTQLYMSPEQIASKPYDYKVDIFSLGLILFEMLVPFTTQMERQDVMMKVRDSDFPDGFSSKFPKEADTIKMMLNKDPSNRLTTRGIRVREPLRSLQDSSVDNIKPEEHFKLYKGKHQRNSSGSLLFPSQSSSSVSS